MGDSLKGKTLTQANLSPSDRSFPEIEAIVDNLPSAQMLELSNISLDIPLKECCKARINSFLKNVVHLCIETKRSFASWKKNVNLESQDQDVINSKLIQKIKIRIGSKNH